MEFNEQLLEVIGGCKDFILVLPENALDCCVDENDWIRQEVTCTMEHKKNIIPVMLDGFTWQEVMSGFFRKLGGRGQEECRTCHREDQEVHHEFRCRRLRRVRPLLQQEA